MEVERVSRQPTINGPNTQRWRSKAVLKAMDGVKRAEMFENLRRANNEISVAKKLQILHSTPQVVGMKKQSVSSRNPQGQYATEGRAHSYNMNSTYDSMKPPSLKQLRMELI